MCRVFPYLVIRDMFRTAGSFPRDQAWGLRAGPGFFFTAAATNKPSGKMYEDDLQKRRQCIYLSRCNSIHIARGLFGYCIIFIAGCAEAESLEDSAPALKANPVPPALVFDFLAATRIVICYKIGEADSQRPTHPINHLDLPLGPSFSLFILFSARARYFSAYGRKER